MKKLPKTQVMEELDPKEIEVIEPEVVKPEKKNF
jgi:hypothetical protein